MSQLQTLNNPKKNKGFDILKKRQNGFDKK